MALFDDARVDSADLADLVNGSGLVTTRYGDNPKKSWKYMENEFDTMLSTLQSDGESQITVIVNDLESSGEAQLTSVLAGIQSDGDAAIENFTVNGERAIDDFNSNGQSAINLFNTQAANDLAEFDQALDQYKESRGFNNKGTFADGFTYELTNDVGIDASGNPWIYNGNLPFTVTAGTTPTAPTYTQVTYGTAAQVSMNTSDTVQSFADSFALKIFQSPTDGGLTEIQTRTVNSNEVYEVRKTSDDSLATIYSDAAGTAEILQDSTDNVSGSDGVIIFYIVGGDYYITSNAVTSNFAVGLGGRFIDIRYAGAATSNSDNSTQIQFISDATVAGDTIYVPKGQFKHLSPLTFKEGVNVIMDGYLTSYTDGVAACTFGDKDTFLTTPTEYFLDIRRATDSNFSSLDDIGIRFINTGNIDAYIKNVNGFTVGVQGEGNTENSSLARGFAWNKVTLRKVISCLIGFHGKSRAGGGGGIPFCNENDFKLGRFLQRNSVATAATTHPDYVNGSTIECWAYRLDFGNSNRFDKPDVTLDWTRSSDGQAFEGGGFWLTDSVLNVATDARFEFSTTTARCDGTSRDNVFNVLYSDPSHPPKMVDTSERRTNILKVQDDYVLNVGKGVWDSGPLAENAHTYGATTWVLQGASRAVLTVGTEPTLTNSNAGFKLRPDYIETVGSACYVWKLDTSRFKAFVIKRNTLSGFSGRLTVSARDEFDNILDDSSGDKVFSDRTISYNNLAFGGWRETSDSNSDIYISVDDDVDHVYLCFGGGTNPLKMKRFSVISVTSGTPHITSGVDGFNITEKISQVTPQGQGASSVGWFSQGETVENRSNISGQPIFWKSSGFGWNNDSNWSGSTSYSVDDIVTNGPNVYICISAGTSASTGGPSGTASPITDNSVQWKYLSTAITFTPGPLMP